MATILCIEDESIIRENIVEELRDAGHNTFEAEDGLTGLELIRLHRPDLVISDISMPRMSGYDLLTELRNSDPDLADTPFMFLSALADRKDVIAGKKMGADDYLVKPIDFENLHASVEVRLNQISRFKKKNEVQAEEYRQEILNLLPHELLTPLNHIQGFAEIIKGQYFGPIMPEYHDYACEIIDASRHLHTIVRNVLDLSSALSGQLKPNPINCDLHLVVEQEVSEHSRNADLRDIDLQFNVGEGNMTAFIDPDLFRSAVGALISNGIKFSPKGSTVKVILSKSGKNTVSVRVEDHGPGMCQEDIDAAMRPFFQIDRGIARKHEGMGNGLALVRAISNFSDMEFRIQSILGEGTTAELSTSLL